jgi:toxin ParE1/3/4
MYRIIQGDSRRHLLTRFPFAVIYTIENQRIYILAVMHLKRKPFYWKDRK